MSAEAWIAFGGLLVMLFVQTAVMAFWAGNLSARAKSNTHRIGVLEDSAAKDDDRERDGIREMANCATKISELKDQVGKLERTVTGLSRQVAALASRRRGATVPLGDTMTDDWAGEGT